MVGDDPGVVLDVGRRWYRGGQRGERLQAPHPKQRALALQLVRQGQGVDRRPLGEEMEHRPEDVGVGVQIEVVGLQLAHNHPDLILVEQKRSQHRALGVDVVWGDPKRSGRPELRPGAQAATTRTLIRASTSEWSLATAS